MQENLEIQYLPVDGLIPYARNSRTHSDAQVAQIAASIREFGFTNPVLIDGEGGIIAGHGRVLAARKLNMDIVPTITLDGLTETQRKAYVIADNKLALNAGWDDELLALELAELGEIGFDLDLTGFSQDEIDALTPGEDDGEKEQGEASGAGSLADRFMLPPFTVLNAREGWWQDRKRAWFALGIRSEIGRDDGLAYNVSAQSPFVYKKKNEYEEKIGRTVSMQEFIDANLDVSVQTGTSIFDPVVCEIAYRWFSAENGLVLDPFAGGSVRGVVASNLNRQYIGHELREEQVAENRIQGDEICKDVKYPPAWIAGDSRMIDRTCADVDADLVFTCPPYADLEVYSDNPLDLSTMAYSDFKAVYFEIIAKSCARLKNDRFAVCVVGEVRDKKGNYIDFVGDTVQAFRDAGLHYYNEAILVTNAGSTAMRAGKQFSASRKLGKTHQNILVFVKGDGKRAAKECGDVEVSDECFAGIAGAEGGDAEAL